MKMTFFLAVLLSTACAFAGETNVQSAVGKAKTASATVTIQVPGGTPLMLDLPSAGTANTVGIRTVVRTQDGSVFFQLWPVASAKTLDDAMTRYADLLKPEDSHDIKVTKTSDVTLAGAPARILVGSGVESDDGDPGQAEVVLFSVHGHIFIACVHGEQMTDAETKSMLAVLQTAR